MNFLNFLHEPIEKQLHVVLWNNCFKKFVNFPERHQPWRHNKFIFVINLTE